MPLTTEDKLAVLLDAAPALRAFADRMEACRTLQDRDVLGLSGWERMCYHSL